MQPTTRCFGRYLVYWDRGARYRLAVAAARRTRHDPELGATFERAHFLGDETVYRELAYTAATRGREETRFYVVAPDPQRSLPRDHGDERLRDLARSLGESRAKELAIDVQARAQTARKSTDTELEDRAQRLDQLLGERRYHARSDREHRDPEALEERLAGAQWRLDRAREQIEKGGWRARRNPQLRTLHEAHTRHVEETQELLREAREHEKQRAQRDRDWWQERRDTLGEAVTARVERARRDRDQIHEEIQAAPYQPGEYITELIGERPVHGETSGWDEAARRLEAYHHTHQPDAPHIEPPTPDAPFHERHDWDQISKAIGHALGKPDWKRDHPTLERGHLDHDLGMDIGL